MFEQLSGATGSKDLAGSVILVEPAKRSSPAKYWSFTWNNYTTENIDQCILWFQKHKYVFQEETGVFGTPHLQGSVNFNKKLRANEEFKGPHWEKTRSLKHSNAYCCKEESRTGQIFTNIKLEVPLKILQTEQLLVWQLRLINILRTSPHNRAIYWFWENRGKCGKTQLCKYICYHFDAILLGGKSGDIKFGIVNYHKTKKYFPDIILFNITRTQEDHINYEAIEMVKDGIFFSGKYEGEMVLMNSPHIVIFANKPPDTSKMSEDRWVVTKIEEYPLY